MYTIQRRLHRGAASTAVVLLLAAISAPLFSMSAFADNSGDATSNSPTGNSSQQATSLPVAVVTTPSQDSNGQSSQTQPAVAVVSEPTGVSASLSATGTPSQPIATTTPASGSNNPSSAPDSTQGSTNQPTASSTQNTASNTAAVNNVVNGQATTGNASVHDNTTAGNATSGTAQASATVVNVINSSTGFGSDNGGFTFYSRDINAGEDLQGNILIDPSTMAPMNGASSGNGGVQTTTSMLDIINNITLNATSGNASVHDNNQAGNATSGDASAIANIINVVNSQIGAQQTFLGVINIYGNLTGDIQVPADFVDGLLGSSATTANGNGAATSSTTTIDNNITTSATSGNATVKDNNQAGNATTGDATTNVTVFNLTGQQVIAKNSLLVFVNVLGKWVGVIVNQPAGATSGALVGGGNATTASNGSTSTTNTHITNNVTANATTGNATVRDNNQAGNATTGNAQTGVNLLNIANSNFSLDGWFGVLFINVLGSWLGNFGIDSPMPDPVSTGGGAGDGASPQVIQAVKVFQFGTDTAFVPSPAKPRAPTSLASAGTGQATPAPEEKVMVQSTGKVLGASDNRANALVSRIDLVALLAIVLALTLLLMLGSWLVRKFILRRQTASA